ncbi:DNA replication/repair protein RecF [candidate division WOR-3 bacterium]|nr:DNA replication/repair protein RecF [candidate division WOR-3 bacterium]
MYIYDCRMYLKSLYVKNFRNFRAIELNFEPGRNLILGDNGVGKTNLVEIVYFLSTFGSFRTYDDRDLLYFGESFFVVSGEYGDVEVKVRYSDEKEVFINGVKKRRLRDGFGTIPVIAFTSGDLDIVNGSPARRRRFMDIGISLYRRPYIEMLSLYNRAWRQRNSWLNQVKTGREIGAVEVWEEQLSRYASPIIKARVEHVNKLIDYAIPLFYSLTGQELKISYKEGGDYSNLGEQLRKMRDREIERGYTLYGPHRDDIVFWVDNHPAKTVASFGTKRALTVSLRMAQARILTEVRGEEPIIILDEIIGELDKERIGSLSKLMSEYEQVLIATAREDIRWGGNFNVYRIENRNGAPVIKKDN